MFTTVFDIRSAGIHTAPISLILGGSLFFILGLLLAVYGWSEKRKENGSKFLFVGLGQVGISSVILIACIISIVVNLQKGKHIFNDHLYRVVEGVPQNYHPMPEEGHDEERFDIQGVKFHYSDYHIGFGYNNAASHGGVIHPGQYYRITYYPVQDSLEASGPSILKIEVKN